MKYKEDDTNSSSPKSSKKVKHKRKKKLKSKEKKKHKKTRRYSASSTSDSSTDEEQIWVEKTVAQPSTSKENDSDVSKAQEPLKREDWMNLNNLFPCVSNADNAEGKKALNSKTEVDRSILDKPGQSDRELNPYWKDGGTGLPEIESKKSETERIMDVNWLKKSLQRAKEQALSEGRSLHEIAAERWGSLEKIQSMIARAESASRGNMKYQENKRSWNKSQRYKRDGRSKSRERNRSRSRSRSRERYTKRENSSRDNDRRRKQTYKRPSDDDYFSHTLPTKTDGNRRQNWRKEQLRETNVEKPTEETVVDSRVENKDESETTKSDEAKPLTEAELNKLGARIVKAEIMGDNELAAKLKIQLENARKLSKKPSVVSRDTTETENVILTRTDAKGVTRPLEPRSQSREVTGNSKKKKNVQTHVSGERVRHFYDDDKYSLDQLFQREKGRSVNEDDAMFTKVVSKNMDMNEIFEEQITRVQSNAKQDESERSQAIKEHKRLTKSLDNCQWCIDSKYMLKHMIVTVDSRICLSLPAHTSMTEGQCVLTPVQHTACQLQLDEDVWKQLRVFKRALCKMFTDQDQRPVFFEVYKSRHKFSHMQLHCVPLPSEIGDSAPMYFKKALLECETEWCVNKKVIDLKDREIRQAVPNGLSYFAVEFGMDGGYAHVIEDERMFPKNFAEEIIGGMLDLDHDSWRKPRKENFEEQRDKVLRFTSTWKKYENEVKCPD